MCEKYLVDKCINLARECERHLYQVDKLEEKLNNRDEALEKAYERIAMLESVELLAELKEIETEVHASE